ncbi:DddA-like double-stranded DNA deaminase toxin [Streptomyces sp. AK02-01A]|uniref:DddA-like double-stranded DNA deaminase toxin n=1 Tax=Streptomyces sp. AK02-01A TaxID=3028648 RepID=UPI0029A73232|nr:DddA-like double-stranded DNA deaminase toxin [Streptomyces sp. AK02-01A]MDX3854369.1 SCP1.201-like deaminase [Streptomyces sp. AK02-01A]
MDYLRTRWKEAEQNDIRQQVVSLSTQSLFASVRTAAAEVLTGTPEQIETFFTTGQYEAGHTEMRVEVARLTTVGGTYVKEAATAALKEGTPKALATFLQVGQYGQQLLDERILTAQLATNGSPELKAAATIALAGPAELVHEFVTVGQYMAQRKDDLATTHTHHVQGLLAEGSMIAAKANEDAWRAAEAAAKAINAAAAAAEAAGKAQTSAQQAVEHASAADSSADAAEDSAAQAAASAVTARAAASRADADAEAAENSAANAEFSAAYARESAKRADREKDEAHTSALAAGKSSDEADADAAAWQRVHDLAEAELKEATRRAEEERKKQEGPRKPQRVPGRFFPAPCQLPIFRWIYDAAQPGTTAHAVVWEISGLADIERCIEEPATKDCAFAALSLIPAGKLKLLTKVDEGVKALESSRAARRTVTCLVGAATSNLSRGLPEQECQKFRDKVKRVLDELPERTPTDKRTTGRLLDENGDPIPELPPGIEEMKSGEKWYDGENNSYDDPLWAEAQRRLFGKKGFPASKNAKYKASSHVETKYAVWMDQKGIKNATVVINNNAGVCDKAQNCIDAVAVILPVGSTLTVYFPGGKKVLRGMRT